MFGRKKLECRLYGITEELRSKVSECEKLRKEIADRPAPSNPHRTPDGQHICECCGVVYQPNQGDDMWPCVTTVRLQGIWPEGKQYKKPATSLLLKKVNSNRFCSRCEEELQEDLEALRFLLDKDTEDSNASLNFRRDVYRHNQAKEGEKS